MAVTVSFGKAIHPPGDDEIDDCYQAFRALAKQVERAVIALRDEVPA